jgi:transporter family-2 protein
VKELIWIVAVIVLGVTQALQVVLLGAMNRARGPMEAAYISILGTVTGMSLTIAMRALGGTRPALPAPLNEPAVTGVFALASGLLLFLSLQGLPLGFALTGLLPVPYLLAASYLAPRIGVALFVAALIAGQLSGGVIFDHLGALGSAAHPVDAVRLLGVAALLAGVILIRGFR